MHDKALEVTVWVKSVQFSSMHRSLILTQTGLSICVETLAQTGGVTEDVAACTIMQQHRIETNV